MASSISTRLKTNEVRFSFVKVFEKGQDDDKYSVAIMIDKSKKKLISAIEEAIKATYEANKDKLQGVKLSKCLEILKDADEEGGLAERYPEFEGCMYLNARSIRKIPVLHKVGGVSLTTDEEFHSGDYGLADLAFFAYNAEKNKGVGCAINAILKTRDGEDLSGGATNALDTFKDDIEDDE